MTGGPGAFNHAPGLTNTGGKMRTRSNLINRAFQGDGSAATEWLDVNDRETWPVAVVLFFTSEGSPTATLTFSYNFFNESDPDFGGISPEDSVVLGSGLGKGVPHVLYLPFINNFARRYYYSVSLTGSGGASSFLRLTEIRASYKDEGIYDDGIRSAKTFIASGQSQTGNVFVPGTLIAISVPSFTTGTAHLGVRAGNDVDSMSNLHEYGVGFVTLDVSTTESRSIAIPPNVTAGFRLYSFRALQSDKSTPVTQTSRRDITLFYRKI